MELAVALAWHVLPFEDLVALVQRAEEQGFPAVFVDGDVSLIPSRGDADVLDGWTLTTALLQRTRRIQVGSIRLVHHWNAAKLAQAAATLDRMVPGRLRFLVSIGGQPQDARFGLPLPPSAARIAWLDETLSAVRALWRGEEVSVRGRFVTLDRARVRPCPRSLAVEVAGRGPRLLELVARHADVWDMNLPPLPGRVAEASRQLDALCQARGRDPAKIRRSMWVFTRPGEDPSDPRLHAEFRRLNPWFSAVADDDLPAALVAGPPAACRDRFVELAQELRIAHPVADLSGLGRDAAQRALDALAPR
ncbi:MAG TPA: LLM class flavin-dependent oxidoreductase [Myxococcota bacterium]|nr:LLM class flavin-dependent oxidoreductase [Myxococcota bacterium]